VQNGKQRRWPPLLRRASFRTHKGRSNTFESAQTHFQKSKSIFFVVLRGQAIFTSRSFDKCNDKSLSSLTIKTGKSVMVNDELVAETGS
jgi:hypothetical protein